MEELYKLSEMLCDELEEYGRKGELTAGSLDIVDKLAHALKSLKTVIAMDEAEEGYSGRYDGNGGMSYRGNSYARGRGMNARRDSRGRYSREGYGRDGGYSGAVDDMTDKLRDLMEEAPSDQVRQEIQRVMSKIEKM